MTLGFSRRRGGFELPNSAIHRWTFDEGTGSTAADSIGSADGTISGASWVSGTWIGDNALDGDGVDDYVETTTLGSFGSSMNTDFALLLTVQTTDGSDVSPMGKRESGGGTRFRLFSGVRGSAGGFEFEIADDTGDSNSAETDSGSLIDDGNPHRVACNKTGNTASDLEIWIDGAQQSVSNATNAFDETNISDFGKPVWTHGINDEGTLDRAWPGPLDDIIVCDDSLTSTEIQNDYDRQPWSS